MRKILLFSLFAFYLLSLSNGQNMHNTGFPFVTNFFPQQLGYSSQNWAITQDTNGLVFIGNTNGVLEFDGTNWTLIRIANNQHVRCLATGDDGVVYVGALGSFGFLSRDEFGKSVYVSLSDSLTEAFRDFSDVWRCYSTSHGVYFISGDKLFRWYENQLFTLAMDATILNSSQVTDQIYFTLAGNGIYVLDKDNIYILPGTEACISEDDRLIVLPSGEGELFIICRGKGCYRYIPGNVADSIVVKCKTDQDDYIRLHGIFDGCTLFDRTHAIATMNGGIVILDSYTGKSRVLNKDRGLQSNSVYALYKGLDGLVWAGMEKGIAILEPGSTLTHFGETEGLDGLLISAFSDKTGTYVSTMHHLFHLGSNKKNNLNFHGFSTIVGANGTWDFLPYKGSLLLSTGTGILMLRDTVTEPLIGGGIVYRMYHSRHRPECIFLGKSDGFSIIKLITDFVTNTLKVKETIDIQEINESIRNIAEDSMGSIWVASDNNGIFKISLHGADLNKYSITRFDTADGLPILYQNKVVYYNGKIRVFTPAGVFCLVTKDNERKSFFTPDNEWNAVFNQATSSFGEVLCINDSTFYLEVSGENGILTKYSGVGWVWDTYALKRIKNKPILYARDCDQQLLLCSSDALYILDRSVPIEAPKEFLTIFRKITISGDSILPINPVATGVHSYPLIPTLNYSENSISFRYAALSFTEPSRNLYKIKLDGFDSDWSPWSERNTKEYTNLPHGKYTFLVVGRNIFGKESVATEFTFQISAPWYKTIWAYLLYIVFGILFFRFSIQLYSRRLRNSNLRLEQKVDVRTQEIRRQKEEIESKGKELAIVNIMLQRHNLQMTRSIHYAKKIQDSILPAPEFIASKFPDAFVFFQPKDIVSGDFYWFSVHKDKFILAVVDCTGHGVPGGFISMIGNILLNDIINNQQIYDPNLILTQLNIEVIKALSSNKDMDTVSDDGMDICLCCIDLENKHLEIAGACHDPIIIKGDELIDVQTDYFSIGDIFSRRGTPTFHNHSFTIEKDMLLYLFSDGYSDQFGGERNSKFLPTGFKEMLMKNRHLPLNEQRKVIKKTFLDWKGSTPQIDDVLVLGVRF